MRWSAMRGLILWLLLAALWPAQAEELFIARSVQNFPEAMLTLQGAIKEHGYTLSRVQRVDIGLTQSGYQTDKYRIVFFGKPEEVRQLSARHPVLIPYLPLKMTIFAEANETLIVTANPEMFSNLVEDAETQRIFTRWRHDIQSIFDDLRTAD